MKLGELCEVVRGSSPRPQGDPKFYGGSVPRLMVADVTRDGKYVTPKIDFLTEDGAKKSRPMKKGDLVIAVSGNPGLPSILETDACIHDGFVGLRNLDQTKVLVDYLYRYLLFFKEKINNQAVGAIFKNLTTHQIAAIDLPLPPLTEQRRIAAILDKADAIRRKRKQAIQYTEELLRATFLDMFGDPGNNPYEFEQGFIADTAEFVTDGTHHTPKRSGEGIYLLSARNIQEGYIDLSEGVDFIPQDEYERLRKRYDPQFGDVLISCSGSVGRVAVVRDFTTFSMVRSVAVIRLKQNLIDPEFLESLFQTSYMKSMMKRGSKQSSQANLFQGAIKELPVLIPPIELQEKWKNQKKKIKEMSHRFTEMSDVKDNLFNSLLQRAFRGEL